jgi:hypothetical protein
MRSQELWPICLQSLTYALRTLRPEHDSFNHVARGPRRRSKMIARSTQLIEEIMRITEIVEITEIMEIVDIAGITSSSLWIIKRKECSITLLT